MNRFLIFVHRANIWVFQIFLIKIASCVYSTNVMRIKRIQTIPVAGHDPHAATIRAQSGTVPVALSLTASHSASANPRGATV